MTMNAQFGVNIHHRDHLSVAFNFFGSCEAADDWHCWVQINCWVNFWNACVACGIPYKLDPCELRFCRLTCDGCIQHHWLQPQSWFWMKRNNSVNHKKKSWMLEFDWTVHFYSVSFPWVLFTITKFQRFRSKIQDLKVSNVKIERSSI